jgi:signal transduction histidine kinase/CheY-like chemotaxis protein/HPt (histidine-containing phosphotransfer) domain-containing protein
MSGSEFYDGIRTAEQVARRNHRLLIVAIAVLAIVVALSGFYVFRQIDEQMEKNAAAASDNRTWVIAQLEVDLGNLSIALTETLLSGDPAAGVERVREQFDILYSRVALLRNGSILRDTDLEKLEEWIYLSGSDGLLNRLIPVIDGPDEDLLAAMPMMVDELSALRSNLRFAIVDAVFTFMKRGDTMRNTMRDTLRIFTGATLWLLSGMAALMLGLLLQSRTRTRHARALELALQNLRTTINSALDAVLILNTEGRVVESNSATVSMFGGNLETVRPRLQDILRDIGAAGAPTGPVRLTPGMWVRAQGVRLDGTAFPAKASVGTGQTVSGRPISVVFIHDITDQIAHEENLAQARNAAMEADEAKARFLAVMSHEMRTPLTGLLSALDLLTRTTKLDDTQAWLSDIIRTCGTTALEQVNNVLHLSRMNDAEAGQYPVTRFSLTRALKDITRLFEPDAARQETSVEIAGVDGGAVGVALPMQLLHRAVGNLLSNAVKFTERGHIRVRLAHAPAEREGWLSLRISVEDSGIGIAAADLDRIFRNFETLDSSYVRVREGSGLGLGIAKLAVEEMGGHIETVSELGKGSCFTIVLEAPMADIEQTAPAAEALAASPLDQIAVLLAEDNMINRTLMAQQLAGLGAIVTTAVDGQDAVEKAMAQPFDLILMDVSMPRLDGLSATRLIRAKGPCRDVPILAITAQAAPERREQYHVAGMTDVMTKPARIDVLVETMLKHVPKASGMRASPAGDPAGDAPVLLADEPHIAALMEDLGRDFVERTVGTFRTETDKAMDLTRRALADRDLGRVRELAHSSAGAAAVLGLCALNEALLSQETAAIAGDDASALSLQAEVEQLYEKSVRHLGRVLAEA